MRRLRFSRLTSAWQIGLAGLVAGATLAARAPSPVSAAIPEAAPAPADKLNVLILADSLGLCGFGKRLDERFRHDPRVQATFTYMTCGTNPLSWLREKPYSNVKTQCGYWTIESSDRSGPHIVEDVYGMTAGHVPKPHVVPKLEDMIEALHPDVLVVQTGSNLFGLFSDAKTVHTTKHAAALEKYFLPFKERAIEPPSRVRKLYWVSPPTSGRVAHEVQEFVYEQTQAQLSPEAMIIDSRSLVSYPYQHMEPDKEHFLGAQMDEWADKVYEIIAQDLSAQPIASLRPLSEGHRVAVAAPAPIPSVTPARAEPVEPVRIARAEPVHTPPPPRRAEPVAPTPTPIQSSRRGPVTVRARLIFKSEPMELKELLPYQESLVAYVYEIERVLRGQYDEEKILVMHPAHIGMRAQRLKYRIGKHYKMRLVPMEGTLWDTAKARDESGQINLQPYIRLEDSRRQPESRTR